MDEYNILNSIKPKFLKTKYPYNLVSPEKILLTQKKITIMAKELSNQKKTNNKTGGDIKQQITFYV
jgi:hypothetical protein